MADTPLLSTKQLKMYFPQKGTLSGRGKSLRAVDGVSIQLWRGGTLGLVGESGCGKSTLGRCLVRLYKPTGGEIYFDGRRIDSMSQAQLRPLRPKMQMVFQDPYSSLNPRMTILQSVCAPLDISKTMEKHDRREAAEKMLLAVGLGDMGGKLPHELSGGQRQRAVIARAFVTRPEFIVCDEPVSALDASVRSSVLNLMRELQAQTRMSYLFISHDLSVVRFLCDRVAVMYLGRIVESGSREDIFERPAHPYTRALLSAVPVPDVDSPRKRIVLEGDVPSPLSPPEGCRFCTRCPNARPECSKTEPESIEIEDGHFAACLDYKTNVKGEKNP